MKEGCVTLRTPLDATMLQAEITALKSQVAQLTHQLDWFKRQLFGRKSERRLIEPNPDQPQLDGFNVARPEAAQVEKETITYQRRKGKRRDADCVTEQGLRFDDSVPIQTIRLSVPADLAGDFESITFIKLTRHA